MRLQPPDADSLFAAALQQADPRDRARFLDNACRDEDALRERVQQLIDAQSKVGSFLESPAPELGPTIAQPPLIEPPGTQIGPYKLREQIGEGGFGVVYVAEQEKPVQRKVALKIIKPGMDTREIIARFEAERQALALMDHPNIAKVLDAGTTGGNPKSGAVNSKSEIRNPKEIRSTKSKSQNRADGDVSDIANSDLELPSDFEFRDSDFRPEGRPYFVMELVRGVPITDFCDERKLSTRDRLALFIDVCRAVQHAHQKGIIHRDIKPSNVMVTLHDDKPVVKVIDFGVAKALSSRLTEKTVYTAYGQMVGTPLYMSPEQAQLTGLDVDTRSDVYSLGVLLYELLTGTTPFDKETLQRSGFDEMRRIIREVEPPRPSARISTLNAEMLSTISAKHHIDPRKLSASVRGELDWIVMKALEKDRNRRYETASGIAADAQRYLNNEPVQACPPSAGYRLRKFVRRNKGPLGASLALAALLVLGTVGTSIGLVWALQAQRTATVAAEAEAEQRQVAETQRDRAKAAERQAKEEAAIAKAVNDFLQQDLLAEAAPEKNARNTKVTVEELLGRAAARIADKFAQQPRLEAAIRLTIGHTYRALGNYPAAQPHLEHALEAHRRLLGKEHRETLTAMNSLALLYHSQGRFAKAEPLSVQALEISRRVKGEEHADTLTAMNNLAGLYQSRGQWGKAEPLFVKSLEIGRRVLGKEHLKTLLFMGNLAKIYQSQGRFDKAEPLIVKALEVRRRVLGKEHPDTLISAMNLAGLYQHQRHFAKAETLYVKTLKTCRRVLGEEHPDTLSARNGLATLYRDQGQNLKAEPLLLNTLEVRRRILGEEHPNTLVSMNNLAALYQHQRQYAKAETLYLGALGVFRRVLGDEHPKTLTAMNNLAMMYLDQRQFAKAEPLLVKALEVRRRVLGEEHPDTLASMNNLATLYLWQGPGQFAKAEPHLVKALEIICRVRGEEHTDARNSMNDLAVMYRFVGQFAKAEPLAVKALEINRRVRGDEHADTLRSMNNLAGVYESQGQFAKADPLLRELAVIWKGKAGAHSPQYARQLATLGVFLLKQKKHTAAEPVLRECLAIRGTKASDDWSTFNTKAMLGASLLGQKKYAEAEPLLLAGYQGLKQREDKIPPQKRVRLTEAIERLVHLYEATGEKEKAAEWRKKLPMTKSAIPAETKND